MEHLYLIEICDPLTLDNRMIGCEYGDNGGPNVGDICSLSCDAGFELSGSDSYENGTWSGEPAIYADSKFFYITWLLLCSV